MNEAKAKTRITIECDAMTALCVIGNLDLAAKHPLNTGPSRVLARSFREQLLGKIAETGLLSDEELQEAFNHTEVEISRHEAQQRLRDEFA